MTTHHSKETLYLNFSVVGTTRFYLGFLQSKKIQKECSRYTFYQSQEKAHELVLIDDKLYSEINDVREECNDMVHQFWLYAHRKNAKVLERKLKRLVRISKKLIKVFEKISRHIGIDSIFDVSLFFNPGKTHKN